MKLDKSKIPAVMVEVGLSECEEALKKEVNNQDNWAVIKNKIEKGDYKLFKICGHSYVVLQFLTHKKIYKFIRVITGVCFGDLLKVIDAIKSLTKLIKYNYLMAYACTKPLAKVYHNNGFKLFHTDRRNFFTPRGWFNWDVGTIKGKSEYVWRVE